jgi:tetratricopeptide (TPR) repeat protein
VAAVRLNYESFKRILFDYVEPDVDPACLPPLLSKAARDSRKAEQYFKEDIVPRLTKEREQIECLLGRFCELIYEDESIPEKQKDALWALADRQTLPEFLSETFIYAVKRDFRPGKYDATPDRGTKVIAFPGQRGTIQSSAPKEQPETSEKSIAAILADFFDANKKSIAIAALPFVLLGAVVVWLGAHFQISFVLEIGCIVAGIGSIALAATQLRHKKRFALIIFLIIALGAAAIIYGKYRAVDSFMFGGAVIVSVGGIIPFLSLLFTILEKWPDRWSPKRGFWLIKVSILLIPLIYAAFLIAPLVSTTRDLHDVFSAARQFPGYYPAQGDNRKAGVLEMFSIDGKTFRQAVKAFDIFDYPQAEKLLLAARDEVPKGESDLDVAALNVCLGFTYMELGQYQKAGGYLNSGYIAFNKEKDNRAFVARMLLTIYDILTGETERALREMQDILEMQSEEYKTMARTYLIPMGADAFMQRSEYANAQICCEYQMQSINILKPELRISAYNNYASALLFQDKYDEALAQLQKAMQLQEELGIPDNADMSAVYHNLAQIYSFGKKEHSVAKTYAERALRLKIDAYGFDNPRLISTYSLCVMTAYRNNDFVMAQQYASAGEKISIAQKDRYPDSAALYDNIGLMYEKMEEYERAISYFNRALEVQNALLLMDTTDTARIYDDLAGVYIKTRDAQAAYRAYDELAMIYVRLNRASPEYYQDFIKKLPALIEEEMKSASP